MYIADHFRIYPTDSQAVLLLKTIGCARYVYNLYLDVFNTVYKFTGRSMNYSSCCKSLTDLKKAVPWLKEADSTALQASLGFLCDGFNSFFRGQNNHPQFHKKGMNDSYTSKNNGHTIYVSDKNHIVLPKIGTLKAKGIRQFEGKIITATVTRKPTGKWFVSLLYETDEPEPLPETDNPVGIDLGLHDFIVTSDGFKADQQKAYHNLEKKLAKEQKILARRREANIDHYINVTGKDGKVHARPVYKRPLSECRNYQKQKIKVARIYEKMANQRRDYEHKLSAELIKNHDVICLEDLNVADMMKNHHIARSIADASWSEFVSMLRYKAERYGRRIIFVDRYYPSSQRCSVCGTLYPYTKDLSVREWECPVCGAHHDRDINAAINIRDEGLRISAAA